MIRVVVEIVRRLMRRRYGAVYWTAEGAYYVAIFVTVFIASMIREINLLLILAGLMAGPYIVNRMACRIKKGYFSVQRRIPEPIHAGSPFTIHLELVNEHVRTLFALVVRQKITPLSCGRSVQPCDGSVQPDNSVSGDRSESVPSIRALLRRLQPDSDEVFWAGFLFPSVKPQEKSVKSVQITFSDPGEYRLSPVEIHCRFPLGLCECRIQSGRSQNFWVYPPVGRLIVRPTELLADAFDGQGQRQLKGSRSTGDFHSVTPWQPGESTKRIHWRSSARRGQMNIRLFQPPQSVNMALLLDLYAPEILEQNCEKAVSLAATIVRDFCLGTGDATGRDGADLSEVKLYIGCPGSNPNTAPVWVSGLADCTFFHHAMKALAVARRTDRPNMGNMFASAAQYLPPKTGVVLITAGETFDAPTARQCPFPVKVIRYDTDQIDEFFSP